MAMADDEVEKDEGVVAANGSGLRADGLM